MPGQIVVAVDDEGVTMDAQSFVRELDGRTILRSLLVVGRISGPKRWCDNKGYTEAVFVHCCLHSPRDSATRGGPAFAARGSLFGIGSSRTNRSIIGQRFLVRLRFGVRKPARPARERKPNPRRS